MSALRIRPLPVGLALFGLSLLHACAAEEIAVPELAIEERDQPFRWAALGDHDHADMTKTALAFLKSGVRERIGDSNESADSAPYKLLSRYHVDNCRIAEAFETINSGLEQTAAAFDPAGTATFDPVVSFGLVTHTAQDFYAHSNWVENSQSTIIAPGLLAWPRGNPGEILDGMVIMAQGSPNVLATRAPGSRVPFATVGGMTSPVLMTGTYADNTDVEICPNAVQIPHGDFVNWDATTQYDSFLAKDGPQTPHHDAAVALAKRQTREELCRLDRLVGIKFGFQGQQLLRSAWVDDLSGFRAACPNNDDMVAALIMAAR